MRVRACSRSALGGSPAGRTSSVNSSDASSSESASISMRSSETSPSPKVGCCSNRVGRPTTTIATGEEASPAAR